MAARLCFFGHIFAIFLTSSSYLIYSSSLSPFLFDQDQFYHGHLFSSQIISPLLLAAYPDLHAITCLTGTTGSAIAVGDFGNNYDICSFLSFNSHSSYFLPCPFSLFSIVCCRTMFSPRHLCLSSVSSCPLLIREFESRHTLEFLRSILRFEYSPLQVPLFITI